MEEHLMLIAASFARRFSPLKNNHHDQFIAILLSGSGRQRVQRSWLKFNSQHELYLPGQACSGIWGRGIVIIGVEIIRRGDHSKVRLGSQKIIVGYKISAGIDTLGEVQRQVVRIAQLYVVKNIENLYAELYREAFGELCILHQSHIDLPGVQRTEDAVACVTKA